MSVARYVRVIMPVGSDPLTTAKMAAIAKGIEVAGFQARFPDYLPFQPSFSLPKLVEELRGAACVIADLSLERPSCYYELGVAEALGKIVHLIAKAETPVHQCAARSSIRYFTSMNDVAPLISKALDENSEAADRS